MPSRNTEHSRSRLYTRAQRDALQRVRERGFVDNGALNVNQRKTYEALQRKGQLVADFDDDGNKFWALA